MDESSDRELALRTRRGESEAFGELVQRYQSSVFNICYRLLGERREAEDLTQEAFVRAYQRLDRFDAERPFGPWMRRLAANLCFNRLKVKRMVSLPIDDERDGLLPDNASQNNPELVHLQAERAESIRAALLSLPPHYRAVIELRHFQDMSYAKIAEHLEIPLSDVKSHLFRARRLLEKKLTNYVQTY